MKFKNYQLISETTDVIESSGSHKYIWSWILLQDALLVARRSRVFSCSCCFSWIVSGITLPFRSAMLKNQLRSLIFWELFHSFWPTTTLTFRAVNPAGPRGRQKKITSVPCNLHPNKRKNFKFSFFQNLNISK